MSKKLTLYFLRGVPELTILRCYFNVLKNLKNKFKKFTIPKFDKSIDDRSSKDKWLKSKNLLLSLGMVCRCNSTKK